MCTKKKKRKRKTREKPDVAVVDGSTMMDSDGGAFEEAEVGLG